MGLFQFVNLACNLTFSVCFYEFVNKNMLPPRIIYCSCVCVSPFPNQSQRERNSFLRQDSLNAAQHFLDSFSRYWDYFYSASDWMYTKPLRSVSRCFIAFSLMWKRPFYSDCFFVAIERGLWARWIIGFLFLTLLNLQFLKGICWSVVSSMLRCQIPNKMWFHIYRFIHLLDTGQNVQWSLNRCWLFLRSEREGE